MKRALTDDVAIDREDNKVCWGRDGKSLQVICFVDHQPLSRFSQRVLTSDRYFSMKYLFI